LSTGTKSFNVDLFGGLNQHTFTYFIDIPGFVPDHSEVEFQTLYPADEIQELQVTELRSELAALPCCARDSEGQPNGLPVNVVLIGDSIHIMRALLRAKWYEFPQNAQGSSLSTKPPDYLFGRTPDAVFRLPRSTQEDRSELRVWLTPMRLEGEEVWLGQVSNFLGKHAVSKQTRSRGNLDPGLDDARHFLLQNLWYSQGLSGYSWLETEFAVPTDRLAVDFDGSPYFTDGYRLIMWLSGTPYSMIEAREVVWDQWGGQ
jgi:hypothetical protein